MHDTDTKSLLPIHIILGGSNFAKTKMERFPKVGQIMEILYLHSQIGEPFAKQKRWVGL